MLFCFCLSLEIIEEDRADNLLVMEIKLLFDRVEPPKRAAGLRFEVSYQLSVISYRSLQLSLEQQGVRSAVAIFYHAFIRQAERPTTTSTPVTTFYHTSCGTIAATRCQSTNYYYQTIESS